MRWARPRRYLKSTPRSGRRVLKRFLVRPELRQSRFDASLLSRSVHGRPVDLLLWRRPDDRQRGPRLRGYQTWPHQQVSRNLPSVTDGADHFDGEGTPAVEHLGRTRTRTEQVCEFGLRMPKL